MFGAKVKLLTLFGFDVKIDASWLFLALLVTWSLAQGVFPYDLPDASTATYWGMGVLGALGLFLSIVLHELSHSLVARQYGINMQGITLFIFGGVAEMVDEPPSPQSEFFMAIAGPIASLFIAAAFQIMNWVSAPLPPIAIVCGYLAIVNVALAVFNMVPAFPLDGGRALRAVLWHRKNDIREATRITSKMGEYFGFALIGLGVLFLIGGQVVVGIWWGLIGLFLNHVARAQMQQMDARLVLGKLNVRDLMNGRVDSVPAVISLQDFFDDHVSRSFHDLYPVFDGGALKGVANVRRLSDIPRSEWGEVPVESIMTRITPDNSIEGDKSALDALQQMERTNQSRLVVLDSYHLAGVITLKDLLKPLSIQAKLQG